MKFYVIAAVILALLGTLTGAYFTGFRSGVTSTNNKNRAAIIKYRDRESQLLIDLEHAKRDREVVYLEEIKIIEGSVGQCLDTDMPSDILRLFNNNPR